MNVGRRALLCHLGITVFSYLITIPFSNQNHTTTQVVAWNGGPAYWGYLLLVILLYIATGYLLKSAGSSIQNWKMIRPVYGVALGLVVLGILLGGLRQGSWGLGFFPLFLYNWAMNPLFTSLDNSEGVAMFFLILLYAVFPSVAIWCGMEIRRIRYQSPNKK